MKFKKIITNWRIILLILVVISSLIAINPQLGASGIVIKNVDPTSLAAEAGLSSPDQEESQTQREKIFTINRNQINTIEDYASALAAIEINETIRLTTNKGEYAFLKKSEEIGITIDQAAATNLRKGLDLQGGTRVLLQPAEDISDAERDDVIAVMETRLNTYGLTDINIRKADDLLGNKYILVEVAGASKQEVQDLIQSQGRFEARIGNETVFTGGEKDITYVCRNDGTCSGVHQCSQISTSEHYCQFQFTISLSGEAAKRHADITRDIPLNASQTGQQYLALPVDFFLDNRLVDSLNIAASLRGQETTSIAISGPGYGATQEEAVDDAVQSMHQLQTVLITGSLPAELNIVKLDSISPSLGSAFVRNAIITGIVAILTVAIIIFIRYRTLKVALPVIIIGSSEIIIILGFAALFRYNLDLAAIAGIIAAVGTGVDDQIVITDEIMGGSKEQLLRWQDRIKKAFFIIIAAYFTTFAAMLPLLRAGAGLLTGFALVTIAGITIGVLITRPAFAAIMQILFEE